jgi:hypothetical protein
VCRLRACCSPAGGVYPYAKRSFPKRISSGMHEAEAFQFQALRCADLNQRVHRKRWGSVEVWRIESSRRSIQE